MTDIPRDRRLDERVLIFAPVGKDSSLTADVLERAGLSGCVCSTVSMLCAEFASGAAAILLTEEALEDRAIGELTQCLHSQPAWSDVPILLFADAERSEVYLRTLRLLEGLRNVVLLERPIRLGAALSLIRSAMRGRRRQYEVRDLLDDLAAAREEAETANRLKDEFLATVSHELRTPLNAILGWTTMLRDGHVQASQATRALDTIHRNAMAQVHIVNDLLDISRVVRGNLQLSARLMPLGPFLALAVQSITPAAEAKGVTLTASITNEPVHVWADHDRLQQVFWNLLSNAVKFTSRGDQIHVSAELEGAEVRICVRDTGIGIAPHFLPHVFERFRQGDGSPTRMHGGLGLGLSIVRHLVELHGGRLNAESEGQGRGACFSVYLPVRRVEAREPAANEPPSPGRAGQGPLDLGRHHVLIVGEEADARDLLRTILTTTGARLTEAGSAAQAMHSVHEDRPDILLVDVVNPHRDGDSLIPALRASPEGQQVLAIAISAYARREDKTRALAAGYDGQVSKPVQPQELLEVIERLWLQRHQPLSEADSNAHIH